MKRILSTILITSLAVLIALLLLLTLLVINPNLFTKEAPEPDYIIEEEDYEASGDASNDDEQGDNWAEWNPNTLSVIDMSVLSAGTILPWIQEDFLDQYFVAYDVNASVQERMQGKSYAKNNDIDYSDLVYCKVIHYNYNHEIQIGEIVVNKVIAEDVLAVFKELFEEEYEIYSMTLIDNFWNENITTTERLSMEANNSSGFCYRTIADTSVLSQHAYGLAIDLNPVENPEVTMIDGEPNTTNPDSIPYLDRTTGAKHLITVEDAAYRIFTKYGFSWGGEWGHKTDYMHFERYDNEE